MPLKKVTIRNFKSIKHCVINFEKINTFIGENGAGKSNIIEALNYFYCNLTENNLSDHIFDENNRFSNEASIQLDFDLSDFVKIAKNNSDVPFELLEDEPENKSKYQGYYKAIISLASETKDKILSIKFSQIKGKGINWNCPYKKRLVIKSLFPIFHIDARNMDVNEWRYIWDVLGELSKVSNSERKTIESRINSLLTEDGKETSKKLKGISSIFDSSDVNVRKYTSSEYAKSLAKIYFSGETITQSGKHLGYYSTGTSSVKYIELLLRAIDEIAKTKLKEPIILIDEPEISLHPNFIDELTDTLLEINNKVCFAISTHSSRFTKNIIMNSDRITLYRVRLINKYTIVTPMKLFAQYSPVSKYRVTDDHVNSYFSKAILFVEGETELELFSNPLLKLIFPALKHIDIFQAMTQTPVLNIMYPLKNKNQTPYICLIDLDKTISYNYQRKKFDLKNEFFSDTYKERMQYKNKKDPLPYLYHQRKRINAMRDQLHIHYFKPYMSCSDINYNEFIKAIQSYMINYNFFVLSTTIEGSLINQNTIVQTLKFIKEHNNENDYEEFYTYFCGLQKTDQLNVLRLVFNGKTDLLYSYKRLQKDRLLNTSICKFLDRVMTSKTSGWISEYINSVIGNLTGLGDELTVKTLKKHLDDNTNRQQLLKEFSYCFPELFNLFKQIDNICLQIDKQYISSNV